MPFEQFIERFKELGLKELRSAMILNHSNLPEDNYGFFEMYCNDENCDCRRVIFEVVSEKSRKPVAYVSFGWETETFYARWLGDNDPVIIKDLQGPILNPGSPQSKLAPEILELAKGILQDQKYVARIKRHYKMFKETVDRKPDRLLSKTKTSDTLPVTLPKRKKAKKSRKRHRPRSTDN
jgi:hypothetical protein